MVAHPLALLKEGKGMVGLRLVDCAAPAVVGLSTSRSLFFFSDFLSPVLVIWRYTVMFKKCSVKRSSRNQSVRTLSLINAAWRYHHKTLLEVVDENRRTFTSDNTVSFCNLTYQESLN